MAYEHLGEIRSMLAKLEPAARLGVLATALAEAAVNAMTDRTLLLETVGETFDAVKRMDALKRRVNTP